MPIFNLRDENNLGRVLSVDTATVTVQVDDLGKLRQLQVNRLAILQSSRAGQYLIGIITRITRSSARPTEGDGEANPDEINQVKITLIGTFADRVGMRENVFMRTLETVPEIDAFCFAMEGNDLTNFMSVIADVGDAGQKLSLGHYTLDDTAEAFLNGNKFFQRHAIVVGGTGSGKSWTTARIVEQAAALPQANAILFDVHGEYEPLEGHGIQHFRIARPSDLGTRAGLEDGVLYLPYWLLGYEALVSLFVDRSDQNAPNQAMIISRVINAKKRELLEAGGHREVLANFTIDSPVPFDLQGVLDELRRLDSEMVPGARAGSEKQGEFHGRLSRMIARLEAKVTDRRLGFLFAPPAVACEMDWLKHLVRNLMAGTRNQDGGGVKVIDFSEVPSDILPLMVSMVAKLAFSVQQWRENADRHPVAILCDEAHLYIPERSGGEGSSDISVGIFERIAKEGRKYGVGLVVISQRPSEVNRTVLSQCNNLVAMRLTNGEDQSVVRRLLPDSLGGFGDLLPILDTGEALVVGDASLLPNRIRVGEPNCKPNSGTVDFWDCWSRDEELPVLEGSVDAWRRQSMA